MTLLAAAGQPLRQVRLAHLLGREPALELDHGLGETTATGATLRTPHLALTGDNRTGTLGGLAPNGGPDGLDHW